MSESMVIRCTVFRDEMPELYDFFAGLPKSKQRRRDAIIRLLLAGLNPPMIAPNFPIPKASIAAPASQANRTELSEISHVPEHGSGLGSSAVESIDASDLAAVFGTK